ncbi:FAD/NAD(P)-binding protein [Phytomonospora sp. NPDC050363]|uniref:FAD/NAD(P)-binding protein n=1 Tax=Phytomonospora sp. NPDC050363 TaxID=3155642 RepID=UPI0033E09054
MVRSGLFVFEVAVTNARLAPAIAVIGCGPGGTSLVERLCANAAVLLAGRRLRVHVVDPYPAGAGRVWRTGQSPLLWTNSFAADITVFPDASSTCAGPVRPGPSLWEWAAEARERPLPDELVACAEELERLEPLGFAGRRLLGAYLTWAFRAIAEAASPGVEVIVHKTSAVDLTDVPGGQSVRLANGRRLRVDAVVLTQGHLDVRPGEEERRLAAHAVASGLTYVPRANEHDVEGLKPGEEVIARGMGLAFIDLVTRLTLGRGGGYVRDGHLRYVASGREPLLLAGSRRGVPYRAKIDYRVPLEPPRIGRFLRPEKLPERELEVDRDLRPLIAAEMAWAHYRRLFTAHPERVAGGWDAFATEFDALAEQFTEVGLLAPVLAPLVGACVPDPVDRFDPVPLDRPLDGRRFSDAEALQEAVREHIAGDVARRGDPGFSPDAAAQAALSAAYAVVGGMIGRLSHRSRCVELPELHGHFSYLSSGPPRERLQQLVALSRAGIVRFLGPELSVDSDAEGFRAWSPAVRERARSRGLVETRMPTSSPSRALDALVRSLYERGELAEALPGGRPSGLVRTVPGEQRLVSADGTPHPARYAVGPGVDGGVAVHGFARPGVDAHLFRVGDAVARTVLAAL